MFDISCSTTLIICQICVLLRSTTKTASPVHDVNHTSPHKQSKNSHDVVEVHDQSAKIGSQTQAIVVPIHSFIRYYAAVKKRWIFKLEITRREAKRIRKLKKSLFSCAKLASHTRGMSSMCCINYAMSKLDDTTTDLISIRQFDTVEHIAQLFKAFDHILSMLSNYANQYIRLVLSRCAVIDVRVFVTCDTMRIQTCYDTHCFHGLV